MSDPTPLVPDPDGPPDPIVPDPDDPMPPRPDPIVPPTVSMAGRESGAEGWVRPFNTVVEASGDEWVVSTTVNGRRRIVSRHPTRAMAEQADVALNASGNYVDEFSELDRLPNADGSFPTDTDND